MRPVHAIALLAALLSTAEASAAIVARWTVAGPAGAVVARVATNDGLCPAIRVDGSARPMTLRAAASTLPPRPGISKPELIKASAFPVTVCETVLDRRVGQARIGAVAVPLLRKRIDRIVVIGDTGCRLKDSDAAWQACRSPASWPFARIAAQAAAWRPDLVIHVGDYHYRETPCPPGNAGCAGSAWGYGWDAWDADLFAPAAPLFAAAPWAVVRGNHENCGRAGRGWFRLLAPEPMTHGHDCIDPADDDAGDTSPTYAVPLGKGARLVVMDLAIASDKAEAGLASAARFAAAARDLASLAQGSRFTMMATHKPMLAFSAAVRDGRVTLRPGNGAIQAAFAANGGINRPVDLLLSGHTHLWEQLSFVRGAPSQFVTGFSGTQEDVVPLPESLPADATPAPGLSVASYSAWTHGFGWMSLERDGGPDRWRATVHALGGTVMRRCTIRGRASRCRTP